MKLEVIIKKAKFKSQNPPLVFVHGAAGGAWYFKNFQSFFSEKGFDSYALSLRGHGQSEGAEFIDTYRLKDYVEDVKTVIDTYQIKPILVGHSMGGAIAQMYVSLYQEDLAGLVLLASAQAGGIDSDSPLGLFFSDAKSFLRSYRSLFPNEKITLASIMNETIFSNRFSDHELREIRSQLTKESALVKKDLLNPFFDEAIKLDIPVCVIGSSGDHIVTETVNLMTADTFHVKPIVIPRLCHFLTIDPEWEIAGMALLKWLESHFNIIK